MLADILNAGCLSKKLVNLVANIELFVGLEVPSSKLFLNTRKDLQCPCILCFASFIRDSFLGVKDPTFEYRRPTVAGEVAGLDSMVNVDVGDD